MKIGPFDDRLRLVKHWVWLRGPELDVMKAVRVVEKQLRPQTGGALRLVAGAAGRERRFMTKVELLRRERRTERKLEEALDSKRRDLETPEATTEYRTLLWALATQRERIARFNGGPEDGYVSSFAKISG